MKSQEYKPKAAYVKTPGSRQARIQQAQAPAPAGIRPNTGSGARSHKHTRIFAMLRDACGRHYRAIMTATDWQQQIRCGLF